MQDKNTADKVQSPQAASPTPTTQQVAGAAWNEPAFWFNKENLTLTAAGIALCGVVASALISSLFSQRSLYLNAVTQERSKWIGSLRTNLSTFISKFRSVREHIHGNSSADEVFDEALDELIGIRSLLILQLNPDNEVDENLISLLESSANALVHPDVINAEETEKLLSKHAQWLLKNEWEKVKHEARTLQIPFSWELRQYFRRRKYREFCTEYNVQEHVQSIALSEEDVAKLRER